jgi:hypothetical protein
MSTRVVRGTSKGKKHMLHRIHELTIAIGTGMRKSEQYGLLWPDVRFDR